MTAPHTPTHRTAAPTPTAPPAAGRSRPRRSERGEGVISTAIAVLIVAFLGIALWRGFDGMVTGATDKTKAQVEQIGR